MLVNELANSVITIRKILILALSYTLENQFATHRFNISSVYDEEENMQNVIFPNLDESPLIISAR